MGRIISLRRSYGYSVIGILEWKAQIHLLMLWRYLVRITKSPMLSYLEASTFG